MKKVVRLSESEIISLIKRVISEQKPDSMMPGQIERFGYKQGDPKTLGPAIERQREYIQTTKNAYLQFKNEYPVISRILEDVSIWFIPYIGPYLVAARGTYDGIQSIKKGDYVLGAIQIIVSPLALGKVVKLLKITAPNEAWVKILETIHKSGIPILIAKGWETFLSWGLKTFGPIFKKFLELLKDKSKMKALFEEIYEEAQNKIPKSLRRVSNQNTNLAPQYYNPK